MQNPWEVARCLLWPAWSTCVLDRKRRHYENYASCFFWEFWLESTGNLGLLWNFHSETKFTNYKGRGSQYKHHNTVKFPIGICPQGMITFISKSFGGRASDKMITEDSGVPQLLDRGDVVLADRGFLIAESVGMCCATLAIPAFTKGKKAVVQHRGRTDERNCQCPNSCGASHWNGTK